MKVNLIYNDKGVSQTFIPHLKKTFQKIGPVKFINAQEIIDGDWLNTTSFLVMPGGKDRPYHFSLQGLGNQQIKNFVEKGGGYIGICAGAYYACSHIEFAKGGPLQVVEKRELKFFPGLGIGPVLGNDFSYQSGGIKFVKISYFGNVTENGVMYYHGGPTFVGSKSFKVIASYSDHQNKPPAIILSKYGKGNVLLSGVHFEYPNREKQNEIIRQKIVSDLFELLSNRT